MSLARRVKRNQEKKERKRFREQLVAEGKKLIFDFKENKLKIVEAKKPIRKENKTV